MGKKAGGIRGVFLFVVLLLLFGIYSVSADIYKVGPNRNYKTPNDVVSLVQDGDVIEIDGGTYDDITVWTKNDLILRGVNGRPHFDAEGVYISNKKAIWVIQGDNYVVDNIEFSGADVPDNNGAGIRAEGVSLTVNNSYFHNNEMGILTANDEESTIIIENTEFHDHGKSGGGYSHNIYIGQCYKFILKNSYSHHAWHGHNVKSRAEFNYILYNRIMDEETGTSSYLLDLPEGGRSYVIGNIFHKGQYAENPNTAISYAAENFNGEFQELYVVGNTFANERSGAAGVRATGIPVLRIYNNIFYNFPYGGFKNDLSSSQFFNNIETDDIDEIKFADIDDYDYSILEGSVAIDSATEPEVYEGFDTMPLYENNFPDDILEREENGALDIGALESEYTTEDCAEADILCVDDDSGATQEYDNIQDALDDASSGDVVLVHEGLYMPTDTIQIRCNSVRLKGKGLPVIDGSNMGSGDDNVNVEGYDGVIIEGFESRNSKRNGIRLVNSDNSIVRNNYAHHNYERGIFSGFCNDLLIEDNECSYSVDEHGIYVSNSGDRPIIRNNVAYGNNRCGIHMNGDLSMGGDGIISGAIVEGNVLYDNGNGGGSTINMDGVIDSVVRNNLIYDAHATGIALFKGDGAVPSTGNEVYHNTVVVADDGRWALNIGTGAGDNKIYNNILLNERSTRGSFFAIAGFDGLESNNNILVVGDNLATPDDYSSYYDFDEWQSLGFDMNSYRAEIDDVFVNYPSDLHIKENSVAVDRGVDVGVYYDIEDNDRPNGNGFDIGAYESGYSYELAACTVADNNPLDGEVDSSEVKSIFDIWISKIYSSKTFLDVINKWKSGC